MDLDSETTGTAADRAAAHSGQLAANGNTTHSHELLNVLLAMRTGDFSVRMSSNQLGIEGKIADTFNEIVAANQRMAQQLERVGQVVGREGKTRQLRNVVSTHRADGMQTLEHSLTFLIQEGMIDYETAIDASLFPQDIPRPRPQPVPIGGVA